ncbi:MAG: AEC family transporter, partial [Spirochaetales bacterium]|nr:AEC family transporter [Spirochaetales bacterium]
MTHYFLPVLYSLLQILILAGIGFVLRRFAGWDQSIFSGISRLIVKVTLPVMFVSRMASMNRSDLISGAFFPFYTFIILGISFVLSFAASRLFQIPRESRRVYMALSSFSNVGYIPLALTDILASSIDGFGEFFGFPLPSLYIGSFIFTYSPMIWSLGSSMITGASGGIRL